MKKQYVLGFMFNEEKDKVLLIHKNRPDYQAGKLNGIGGQMEEFDNNNSLHAMIREFKEETGLYIDKWEKFCELSGVNWDIAVFKTIGNLSQAITITDEEVGTYDINNLPVNCLTNLKWLIQMALEKDSYIVEEL